MSKNAPERNDRTRLSEEHRGELQPLDGRILLVDYDPRWPGVFRREADRIGSALGRAARRIEHAGSTSVPGLAAKPIIDIILVVADSANEGSYLSVLEGLGYVLRIREANWHEHRMLEGEGGGINLHVFSAGCPEVDRMLVFRDWLRRNADDRDYYARTKLALAERGWKCVQDYADAKTAVVEEIVGRATLALDSFEDERSHLD